MLSVMTLEAESMFVVPWEDVGVLDYAVQEEFRSISIVKALQNLIIIVRAVYNKCMMFCSQLVTSR